MLEKIEKLGNFPLVIILIVVVIIAIVLSIVKAQKSDETNANINTNISEAIKKEEKEEQEQEQVQIQEEEIIDVEDLQEVEENTEEEENTDTKYFIKVNYGQNVVTIYTKDTNGKYTVPYKAMVCSTGKATPRSGTYAMPSSGTKSPRGVWGMMIGNVWAQYYTRIKGSILFHSVPYTEKNKWSLEYWEYDKLGTAASAGCIRLTVEDAKWIYNNCPAGTKVEFYTDSNPGPLGKPTAQKISEEEVRGWDPTDPDASNPWKTYTQKQEIKENDTTKPPTTTNPTTQNPEPTPEQEPEPMPEPMPEPTPTPTPEQEPEPDSTPDLEPTPAPAPTPTPTPELDSESTPTESITSSEQ